MIIQCECELLTCSGSFEKQHNWFHANIPLAHPYSIVIYLTIEKSCAEFDAEASQKNAAVLLEWKALWRQQNRQIQLR